MPVRLPVRRIIALICLVLLAALGTACAGEPAADPAREAPDESTGESSSSPGSASPPTTPPPTTPATPTPRPRPARVRGVDASHHQGRIDWRRVADAGYEFAYLKASEGSTFTDPRFAENVAGARDAGLRVSGYHYFSLCSPGAPQGEHFVSVLKAAGPTTLPPAVDLELQGQCATLPSRESLLAEVRAFLAVVEEATGRRVVVYEFPDFEREYRFADVLDRRQWVRRIGSRPPDRPWWIWQRSDSASIPGIDGPADLNVMRGRR